MYDYLIIGAGIIGLNIAKSLKEKEPLSDILIIEKESEVGLHSSGRNAGVLHCGFYFTQNSLKAKLTQSGHKELKAFCQERNLQLKEAQKVVIANNEDELKDLEELAQRAQQNNASLFWLNETQVQDLFPHVKTYKKALYFTQESTASPKEVTQEFAKVMDELGVKIRYNCQYLAINEHILSTTRGDFSAKKIINCAGLYADNIAKDFGFSKDYVIIPFKGTFVQEESQMSKMAKNVYSVPTFQNPNFGLQHSCGNNSNNTSSELTTIPAFWREHYDGVANFSFMEFMQIAYYDTKLLIKRAFGFHSQAWSNVQKTKINFFKLLFSPLNFKINDSQNNSGIRAQLLNKNTLELEDDFIVESDKRSVHILNMVSPAFTSSIAFANWVVEHHVLKSASSE